MKIGGVQKLSLIDFPGKSCAALFTIGCNMRCGYCHNPELVLPEQYAETIPIYDILSFLESRRGLLDGVAISGGEPTIHKDLPDFIRKVKSMGFAVKLDSNGTNPAMLATLYSEGLLDFVAMDIKGPLRTYQQIAAYPVDILAVQKSIKLIKDSGVDYEFRTTVVKSQISRDDFTEIGELLRGVKRYALQHFRPGVTVSPAFASEVTYSDTEFEKIREEMECYVEKCIVR